MVNNSDSIATDPLGRSRAKIGFEVSLAILVCLACIPGNLLVIYVINKDSRLKSITNTFIRNLALTDISMATLHMPFWIVSLYTGTWNFSQRWCEISAMIQFTLGIASILNMGVIALNRYIRVVKPALYSRIFPSKRTAWFYCVLVWLVALLCATPPLYGWGKFEFHAKFSVCTFSWKIEQISYLILVVGGVVNGCTVAIFYCYYKIYQTVKQSSLNLNAHNVGNQCVNARRTDIKLLKASFTVVCVFVMTWGPVSIVVVIETAGCKIPREIFATVIYLMFSSSYVNPIIYGIMNPQFQLAFKKALSCGRYGNDNVNQNCTGNGASKRTTNDEGRLAVSTQNSAFSKTLTTEQSVSEHKDATMLGSVLE